MVFFFLNYKPWSCKYINKTLFLHNNKIGTQCSPIDRFENARTEEIATGGCLMSGSRHPASGRLDTGGLETRSVGFE